MSENKTRELFKRIVEELSDVQVAEMNAALHGSLIGRTRTIVLDEKTEFPDQLLPVKSKFISFILRLE